MDEYVRRAYKFAYSDCIEMGPLACLPEPPDPNELYPRQSSRQAIKYCLSWNLCILFIIASFYYCHWLSYCLDTCFIVLIAASLISQEIFT